MLYAWLVFKRTVRFYGEMYENVIYAYFKRKIYRKDYKTIYFYYKNNLNLKIAPLQKNNKLITIFFFFSTVSKW